MSKGNDLDEAVETLLETVTGHECFIIHVDPNPGIPYTVVYPQPSPRGDGSFANPEEDRDYVYQVTSVGADPRQVRRVQEMVEEAFLSRVGGGGYEHAITVAGYAVQWRLSDSLGAVVRSGDELFKADDMYRVRIGR